MPAIRPSRNTFVTGLSTLSRLNSLTIWNTSSRCLPTTSDSGSPQQRLGHVVDEYHAAFDIRGDDRVADTRQRGPQRIANLLRLAQGLLSWRKERLPQFVVLGLNAHQHLVETLYQPAQFVARELVARECRSPGLGHRAGGLRQGARSARR